MRKSKVSSPSAVVSRHFPSSYLALVMVVPNRMCGRIPRSSATCRKYAYLGARWEQARPIRVGPKRVGVIPRGDIAGETGIGVVAPGASDIVGLLENGERVDPGVLQLGCHA